MLHQSERQRRRWEAVFGITTNDPQMQMQCKEYAGADAGD